MTRRIIFLIVAGILFISLVCVLDEVIGPSSHILPSLLALPFKVIFIGAFFLLAFFVHRLAWHIAGGLAQFARVGPGFPVVVQPAEVKPFQA